MKGESDGQRSYSAEDRELPEIFEKTEIFYNIYNRVANADLSIKWAFECPHTDIYFLNIGGNYRLVEAYKTIMEQGKADVLKARKQFEEHKEDLIKVYGEEMVKSKKEFLYDTLDEEYRKFDASVEKYEKLIENLDFEELFETYKKYNERSSQIFLDKPFTDEDMKNELLAVEILVPVSEGSKKLKIAEPYETLEELKKYCTA